jgi:membrane fusion protein (multidrug efflux system)
MNILNRLRRSALAALAATALLNACSPGQAQPAGTAASSAANSAAGPPAAARPATPVFTAPAVAGSLQDLLDFTGEILADRVVNVAPLVSGQLHSVLVDEGDSVTAGQPLFELDMALEQRGIDELSALRQSAAARLDLANSELERARREIERQQPLLDRGAITVAAFDRLRDDLTVLESAAQLASVQQQEITSRIRTARENLTRRTTAARSAGLVITRLLEVGATATPGTPVLTMVDAESLELVAMLPERLLPILQPGTRATVRLDGAPANELSASLIRVAPVVQRDSRTVETRFRVEASPVPLRHGMFVRGRLVAATVEGVLIPARALTRLNENDHVWVVRDSTAVARPVQVLLRAGEQLAVSGVEDGDQVVLSPPVGLIEGATVAIVASQESP